MMKKSLFYLIHILPVLAFSEYLITLDQATAITNGLKICDTTGNYCVNITRNAASNKTVSFAATPLISNGNGGQGTNFNTTGKVILDYSSTLSPRPFNLKTINLKNINSLSATTSRTNTSTAVRDGYAWTSPGTWTILGTGGTASPAGATVTVTNTGDRVGVFDKLDPDTFGGFSYNVISYIGQFTVLPAGVSTGASATLSNVLLNMVGELNGHNVNFTFNTATPSSSFYIFNTGDGGMAWNYDPSVTVTLPDLTLYKKVINDNSGTATPSSWTLEANINGGVAEVSGTNGVSGSGLTTGAYNLSELNGPSGYTLTSITCVNATPGGTNVSGVSLANPIVTIATGDAISCTFTNDDNPPPPPCGLPVLLVQNEWIQISRPCGLEDSPTIAEVFASSIEGTYGDEANWVMWKFDGTNPLPSRSDRYIMITDSNETMKLGVGYWFISDSNVTWDIANEGDSWYDNTENLTVTVPSDGTLTGLNDADVQEFRIVNPIADSGINYIRDEQDVLLGNPFNKAIEMNDVYVSNDNGTSYIPLINAGAFMSTRAYVSDISAPEAQPYRAVSATGTPGIGTEIPVKEGAWFYMHGGYSNHANIRIALPLQK